ncbi:caveolae-associated protein 1 [Chanos chanos]|uniref:Caveolae-associated protein 1 n=1 Tax=Chanos chanos TaxID=29144 RepID=A0A6J2X092_CHACN|nr:caveolae-associated protein 1 [Chanos chanos]
MADSGFTLERAILADVSDDEEIALVPAAVKPDVKAPAAATTAATAVSDGLASAADADLTVVADGETPRSEAQNTGMMVLALLDKIIGVVDQIQQTQTGLESRQESMEKSVTTIQTELAKLTKSHTGTAGTAAKLLEKVRKVNANVKSVRGELDRQAGQIKKLESNEHELLRRKNFKVLIYQDKVKPVKAAQKPVAEGEQVVGVGGGEDDEEVEVEEIVEESRAERIKRSGLQRVDDIKKAFSKENMEKTRQRTRDNLEKTRKKTRENLQKTKHNLEKKMGQLGTKMTPNTQRKEKIRSSREKLKKSLTPEHAIYARSKSTTYRVPPFTFHVKKIREGEVEPEPEPEEETKEDTVDTEKELHNGSQESLEVTGVSLERHVEEGELVNLGSPEMEALLEVADHSQLVIRETERPKERAGQI